MTDNAELASRSTSGIQLSGFSKMAAPALIQVRAVSMVAYFSSEAASVLRLVVSMNGMTYGLVWLTM